MKNSILLILISFALGGTLVGFSMFSQIENRYEIGKNQGYLTGATDVFKFIQKNVKNNESNIKELGYFFDLKASRISVVEINGVKTLIIK